MSLVTYWPSADEIRLAEELISSGHLPATDLTNLATRIQTTWSESCWPGGAEVRCANALITTGKSYWPGDRKQKTCKRAVVVVLSLSACSDGT